MEKSNVEKIAEEIIDENKRLKMELDDCNCKIKEMQNHIYCLEADLSEAQDNKIQLPHEPIKVAEMLIDATGKRENCMTGKEYGKPLFEKWQLGHIAIHLLVYCNNAEE